MTPNTPTGPTRRIALVAHDNCKRDMLEWAAYNRAVLAGHELIATATTGRLLADELGLPVTRLHSGPMGGDQQVGARIVDGLIDLLVFLMGPDGAASARPPREGPAPGGGGVERPRGLQPGHRRLHDLLAAAQPASGRSPQHADPDRCAIGQCRLTGPPDRAA